MNLTRPTATSGRAERRRYWQHQRDAISAPARELAARQIAARLEQMLTALLRQRQCDFLTIGVFWPIRSEPDLLPLWQRWQVAQRLALPAVVAPDQPLRFVRWNADSRMRQEAFGAQVPIEETESEGELVVAPDLLVLPCVAWNIVSAGVVRLGYGGGFYDRTLQSRPCLAWGVAYDELHDSSLEPAAHDSLLDAVVTPQLQWSS